MIFDKPTSFAEAIASRKAKALMPTTMSSAELAKLDAELLERAMFAARVDNAQVLQTLDEVAESIINPKQETREGVTVQVGDTLTSGKAKLRQTLDAIDYQPPEGKEGTIESVSSEQRMELMIRMQVQFSEGYGDWKQGQQRDVLDMWPAVELRRIAPRVVPRGTDEGIPNRYWQTRWVSLGGRLYNGRMICPKNDPIMAEVSLFGIPYGPPGFNSGYDWRDVSRAEAERLGVIAPGQRIAQQERNFMADTRASVAKLSQALKDELLDEMGEGYAIQDDALGYSSGGDGRVMDYGNEKPGLWANAKRLIKSFLRKTRAGVSVVKEHFREIDPAEIKPVASRVYSGFTIKTRRTLSKLETGEIGERIIAAHLTRLTGKPVHSPNTDRNNYPLDIVHGSKVIEVKAGLVSNGATAQHWRSTIGQPGPKEQAWLAKASAEAKAKWNQKKSEAIIARKLKAAKEISAKLGKPVELHTFTTIINPDTNTVDVYQFKGAHSRIVWNSEQANKGYVATYKYKH